MLVLAGAGVTSRSDAVLAAGGIDPNFDAPSLQGNHLATQLLVQDDKRILVGKVRLGVDSHFQRLVRLLPDGPIDESFATPVLEPQASQEGVVLALQGSKILVGGDISSVNGQRVDGVARLNPDGSLDGSFNVRHAFGETVLIRYLVVGVAGEIYLGGYFSGIEGHSPMKVVKLSENGGSTSDFVPCPTGMEPPWYKPS